MTADMAFPLCETNHQEDPRNCETVITLHSLHHNLEMLTTKMGSKDTKNASSPLHDYER